MSLVTSSPLDKTSSSRYRLVLGSFQLGKWGQFFTMKTIREWNNLTGDVGGVSNMRHFGDWGMSSCLDHAFAKKYCSR